MDAAVVPKRDERSGELPVAFIVRRTPSVGNNPGEQSWMEPSEDDIKAFVASRVTSYKWISEVRFIDVIPKSVSGKILRRVLRDKLVTEAA